MSAYRPAGRLTPAAQRLDLLQAWADHRRQESGARTPGLGECGWHWFELKRPATTPAKAVDCCRSRRADPAAGRVAASRWQA